MVRVVERDERGRSGTNVMSQPPRVLVTGASGYVGGRLAPALLDAGCRVRCLARTPAKLDRAPWRADVEVVAGSVGGPLDDAMRDVDVAVYLVHSIGQGPGWAQAELDDATNFAEAAATAGLRRIVFVGGLGADTERLSPHLASRHAVGRALASTGIDVVELRAGVIIGSGSASFEMLRYLVELLPFMVTPRWVNTQCQPIAISDIVALLVRASTDFDVPAGVYEVGGPDIVSYAEMMELYAEVAGLPRRRFVTVPVLTPGLSSHWVGLVTPVPVPLARELVESLVNEVVVTDHRADEVFGVRAIGLRDAISRALASAQSGSVPTSFVDADLAPFAPVSTDPRWSGGTTLTDIRRRDTWASPATVYATLEGIGGARGWYSGELLWQARGILDQLFGGPGLRRGRRDPDALAVGDALDFWRVQIAQPNRLLRLHAEMRLPGEAWLEWDLAPEGTGTRIVQTAEYRPRGLLGRAYWLGVAPFHRLVFPRLLAAIVADAESRHPVEPADDR
jgi:uncharacterized protein YbjT (DUF2867 family)